MVCETEAIISLMKTIIKFGEEESELSNIDLLFKKLSEINILAFDFPDAFDDAEYPDPPNIETKSIELNIQKNFPEFYQYEITAHIKINSSEDEIFIGYPEDDLTDIIKEFKDIIWYYNNTTIDNTAWFIKFGYKSHWGKHLNDLLYFLYHFRHRL